MRRILSLLIAASLAGCATHSHVTINAGSVSTSTQVQASAPYGSAVAALLVMAGIAYAWHGAEGRYGDATGMVSIPVPPLDETRSVREHDCTKPIENFSANLKCR